MHIHVTLYRIKAAGHLSTLALLPQLSPQALLLKGLICHSWTSWESSVCQLPSSPSPPAAV